MNPRFDLADEPSQPAHHGRTTVATACLVFGVAILMLALAAAVDHLPFSMPRSWYSSRSVWIAVGLVSTVAGVIFLRVPRASRTSWSPRRAGSRFGTLILYTRVGCHLCEEAKDLLAGYADFLPVVEEVDIDADPLLVERFGTCVPVVEIDGKVRFRGRVNEILLRRLIDRTPIRDF